MDTTTNITRRHAIAMLPAVALISTPSAATAPGEDAMFHKLFADWRAAYLIANDDYSDSACESLWAIEDQMAAMCPTTAAGLAIKFLVMTSYGEFDLDSDRAQTLFADAKAITGMPDPWRQRKSVGSGAPLEMVGA